MAQNSAKKSSLFERIGGEGIIHAVVDKMYQKIEKDPVLQPFFNGVDMSYVRRSQIEYMVEVFGGSYPYATGRVKHFEAVEPYLKEALTEMHVSPALITEILNLR